MLQRVAGLGAASTPQLQVAPMFAIQGKPRTPSEGCVCFAYFYFEHVQLPGEWGLAYLCGRVACTLWVPLLLQPMWWHVSSEHPWLKGRVCRVLLLAGQSFYALSFCKS